MTPAEIRAAIDALFPFVMDGSRKWAVQGESSKMLLTAIPAPGKLTQPWPALKRTRPGQTELDALIQATRTKAARLGQQAAAGSISPQAFGDRMADLLETAHTEAVLLGRGRAGDFSPVEADDRKFAESVVDSEAEFLAAFQADLAEGRYAEDPDAAGRRAALYSGRLTGTANEVWTLASEDTARYHWRLGGSERSCDECPRLAAGGPYTVKQLAGRHPGSNQQPCLFNCKCYLERTDGARGFRVPEAE